MLYRSLPGGKPALSILGYGCMRFPTTPAGTIDKNKAKAQVRGAIDQGLNYLDTAYIYHMGASERFLGEHVLTDGYREKVQIATKLPCMLITKEEQIQKYFDKHLERLNTDHIDFYLLHALNGSLWARMKALGIIDFMKKIKESGQITHMGFSFHGPLDEFKTICDEYPWDFTQVQYNLLDEHFQAGAEGIDYAAEKNMGVIIMEPLRGGILVGKIPKTVQAIWDSAPIKRSPADWALRWIWNNPNVTVVLSGMNEDAHIKENLAAASEAKPEALTDAELITIQKVKDEYRRLLQVRCTGCRYCLPCPAGINIPAAFHSLNSLSLFGNVMALYDYAAEVGFTQNPSWTSKCIDCGACERMCPQNIEIRKEFIKVRRYIENPIIKGLVSIIRLFWTGTKRAKKQ
ncbi:MAG: aldo/keto reductase [Eubacteriales bacterium]